MRDTVTWENDVVTVGQLLQYAAEKFEEKPAVQYAENGEVISKSFRDLYEDSRGVSEYLGRLAPARCHVGIIGHTDYEYLTSMNAVFMSGCVLVPFAPDNGTEKLITLLKASDTEVLFYDKTAEGKLSEIKAQIPSIHTFIHMGDKALYSRIYSAFDRETPFAEDVDPDECAAIMYTSGTTGDFKGVMLSSRAIISNVYFKEMDFEGENVTLNVLPMHHIFCFSCDYLKNIKDGVTLCLNVEMQNIYKNLLLFEPTVLRLVPMIIESLVKKVHIISVRHPELGPRQAAEQVFGRRIKNIIASGATLSPALAHKFDTMGITIRQGYGMTETGPRIAVPDGKTVCESGGRIISIAEVRLKDGEIQVKSPSLMLGYYKNEAETEKVFTEDGWFRTGDLGEITEDRELFIRGRIKNLIILSNGENVSPEEIEKKYADEKLVKEIVVYGKDDKIAAEIYPDFDYARLSGIENTEEEIRRLVDAKNLAGETTREISLLTIRQTPFKRTASGKIIRKTGAAK